MRKVFAIILITCSCLSCRKETGYRGPGYQGTATIIGVDARMAPCTGGTYIKIDGHVNVNNVNGYFDIGKWPGTIKLEKFPVKVALDWTISEACFGNYVDISRVEVIE